MSEVIEYVDPNVLKPDPYQPRHPDWGSNEVRAEIERLAQTYDAQDLINPIEVDEDNVIILGERRWRAALLKGLEKVPIRRKVKLPQKERLERQLIDDAQRRQLTPQDRVWAWATSIVNINKGENYTIDDIKKMYEDNYESLASLLMLQRGGRSEERGASALSRIIGVHQRTIGIYMTFFKVGKDLQDLFMDGKIDITYLNEVSRLKDDEEQKKIEKLLVEDFSKFPEEEREKRRFSRLPDLVDYVTAFNKELERAAEERAKEIIEEEKAKEEEKPEVKPSKEAVEKRAKEKAKKPPKKTPQEKAEAALLTGRGNAKSKIDKARELGVDVTEFEERLEEIKAKIPVNPEEVYEEAKQLKADIDDVIKEAEKTEEEKKREAEIREKAKREAKKELLEDEEFRKKAVEKQRVEEAKKVVGKISKRIELSPDEKERFKESMQEYQESLEKLLSNPVVEKRGQLFRNWFGHSKIIGFTDLVSCPKCGNTELSWNCHNLTLEEARDLLQKKYEETYEEDL